jgi:3-hydroxyacyl-CoA dehydrogenase/enoyl-CoA hydratase/3-hydroxybutyryl-CoA epimerase
LWPGLKDAFAEKGAAGDRALEVGDQDVAFTDLQERMLFAEALETVKCFDEGVLTSVPDANIGSIFGIGFPAWTGGVIQYINQYSGGLKGFVARSRELAQRYGDHFAPPQSLVDKADQGELYA